MGDLNETAAQRGLADARKIYSTVTFRFVAVLLPALAGFSSNALGNAGTVTAAVTGVTAFTALLLVLLFSFWRAPYKQRDEARRELENKRELDPSRKTQLSRLLKHGRKYFVDKPKDVREWWGNVKLWIGLVEDFLGKAYGPHEAELFMAPPTPAAASLDGSVSHEHNQRRLQLKAHIEEVRRILEKYPD
jgi:hypothetical protein